MSFHGNWLVIFICIASFMAISKLSEPESIIENRSLEKLSLHALHSSRWLYGWVTLSVFLHPCGQMSLGLKWASNQFFYTIFTQQMLISISCNLISTVSAIISFYLFSRVAILVVSLSIMNESNNKTMCRLKSRLFSYFLKLDASRLWNGCHIDSTHISIEYLIGCLFEFHRSWYSQ